MVPCWTRDGCKGSCGRTVRASVGCYLSTGMELLEPYRLLSFHGMQRQCLRDKEIGTRRCRPGLPNICCSALMSPLDNAKSSPETTRQAFRLKTGTVRQWSIKINSILVGRASPWGYRGPYKTSPGQNVPTEREERRINDALT